MQGRAANAKRLRPAHLDAPDTPYKMSDTLRLWEDIANSKYDVVLSDVTLYELNKCAEPKLSCLKEYLAQIDFTEIFADNDVKELAEQFIKNGILSPKSFDDCRHIACSMIYECDLLVSWNFKHIVNHKTIKGLKVVSGLTGYDEVAIYTPSFLVQGDDDDE